MVIVVGAGLTGCAAARALAERGRDVLLPDKKPRVGGACYDYPDGQGAYIHKYGPHTFHTNSEKVYGFISRFSRRNNFTYRVLGHINGKLCPIPFNFTSIETCFSPSAAEEYKSRLSGLIDFGGAAAIGTLLSADDAHLKCLARFIYENVFLEYTKKQWGMSPEELCGGVP
ncbi:hypothetical protein FACS1894216_21730 [Synergistales bacterium]|nr:hypothetical protein FACS1894216_21730 [Synergistales bacterium]